MIKLTRDRSSVISKPLLDFRWGFYFLRLWDFFDRIEGENFHRKANDGEANFGFWGQYSVWGVG